jgi:hypothetical protein
MLATAAAAQAIKNVLLFIAFSNPLVFLSQASVNIAWA